MDALMVGEVALCVNYGHFLGPTLYDTADSTSSSESAAGAAEWVWERKESRVAPTHPGPAEVHTRGPAVRGAGAARPTPGRARLHLTEPATTPHLGGDPTAPTTDNTI